MEAGVRRTSATTTPDGPVGPAPAIGRDGAPGSVASERPATLLPGELPPFPTTRFAPAPTGLLHLGHVLDAIYVWGVAGAGGGRVVLRIEDHDRQRSRAVHEAMLLEDLEWLGLRPDVPSIADLRAGASPYRQHDDARPYAAALAVLAAQGIVYACRCTRGTFAAWAADHGRPWRGPGCPGGCRDDRLADGPGRALRVALGIGVESFDDLLVGRVEGEVAPDGDLAIRDVNGNWTYNLAVVVDDIRHGVDLVIRGSDLVDATARQIRLARLLGRERPPTFVHHPLIRRADGSKLSKADRDTGIRELRAAGWSPARVLGEAAATVGLIEPGTTLSPDELPALFSARRLGQPRAAARFEDASRAG